MVLLKCRTLWRNKQNYPAIILKYTPYLLNWSFTANIELIHTDLTFALQVIALHFVELVSLRKTNPYIMPHFTSFWWLSRHRRRHLNNASLPYSAFNFSKWAVSWENRLFAEAKTKTQISFAVTGKLISAFVFATKRVQSLYFLDTKFQASSHLL